MITGHLRQCDVLMYSLYFLQPTPRSQVSDLVSSVRTLYNETNAFFSEKISALVSVLLINIKFEFHNFQPHKIYNNPKIKLKEIIYITLRYDCIFHYFFYHICI